MASLSITNDFDYALDTFRLTVLDKDTYRLQGKMTSGTHCILRKLTSIRPNKLDNPWVERLGCDRVGRDLSPRVRLVWPA